PIGVEGAGGVFGVVVVGAGGLDRVEAGGRDRRQRGVGGPGDHDVRVAVLDQPHAVAHGVEPGRASGGDEGDRSLGPDLPGGLDGDRAGHHVAVEVWDAVLVV